MTERSVLFVGLSEGEIEALALPEGVASFSVGDVEEAVELLSLTPPSLIVANDRIGDLDSLDFFQQILRADPNHATPVVFVAPPGTGVRPFLYACKPQGFDVRYLDSAGVVHDAFVPSPTQDKSYEVRGLDPVRLADELAHILVGRGGAAEGHPDESAVQHRLWEVGFNNDVRVGEVTYHVQTEVVQVDPLTVTTSVFAGGQAAYHVERKIRAKSSDLPVLRAEVEGVHVDVVSRLKTREIQ